ncbi:NADH-quinone oxidoreductase subunit K [Phytoactinopolyspora halotolerans]|uniref:Sodium:proton antiporter n=1 Tax=Phytoactinopolyspora halotolerans TaxID=1981512 RepID=A0A6L9SDB9_9ACTN|nr:NADH-quinone oxidoreductase subunit K [Phytoactinopolyspora halotolerans]NEE02010.1 sodium:proton antiporter [Phytoactinopolyspora halotolerans]
MNATNLSLALTIGVLYACGSYLLMQRALLRVVLGFVLFGHGANLLLLLAGGEARPVPHAGTTAPGEASDPLPQAMAITAVVITFGTTALLLALVHRAIVLHGDDLHASHTLPPPAGKGDQP